MKKQIRQLRSSRTLRQSIQRFCDVNDLVYFGSIKQSDEIHLYRGVTFSPNSKDDHYCHGTVNEYDLSLFTRQSKHPLPGKQEATQDWTVLAVHLKMGGLPHIIVDAHKHGKTFSQVIAAKFPRLRRASSLMAQVNQSAVFSFDMYARADSGHVTGQLFDDLVLQRLVQSYSRNNVELDDDVLYVYRPTTKLTPRDLKDMLAEALWLSETIENRAHFESPVLSAVA